jgi:hypothetical protein
MLDFFFGVVGQRTEVVGVAEASASAVDATAIVETDVAIATASGIDPGLVLADNRDANLGVASAGAMTVSGRTSITVRHKPARPRFSIDAAVHRILVNLTADEMLSLLKYHELIADDVTCASHLRGAGVLTDLECNIYRAKGSLTRPTPDSLVPTQPVRVYNSGVFANSWKAWQVVDELKRIYASDPAAFLCPLNLAADRRKFLTQPWRTWNSRGDALFLRCYSWPEDSFSGRLISATNYATRRFVKSTVVLRNGTTGAVPDLAALRANIEINSRNGLDPRVLVFSSTWGLHYIPNTGSTPVKWALYDGDFQFPQAPPGIDRDLWRALVFDAPAGTNIATQSNWKWFWENLGVTIDLAALNFEHQARWIDIWNNSQGNYGNNHTGGFGNPLTITELADNGSGGTRVTCPYHRMAIKSGYTQQVVISGVTGDLAASLNGTRTITATANRSLISATFDVAVPFASYGLSSAVCKPVAPLIESASWSRVLSMLPMTMEDDWQYADVASGRPNFVDYRQGDPMIWLFTHLMQNEYADDIHGLARIAKDRNNPSMSVNCYEVCPVSPGYYTSGEPASIFNQPLGVNYGTTDDPHLQPCNHGFYGLAAYAPNGVADPFRFWDWRSNERLEGDRIPSDSMASYINFTNSILASVNLRPALWFSNPNYATYDETLGYDYWQEMMCHLALSGAELWYWWARKRSNEAAITTEELDAEQALIAATLAEINEAIRWSNITPVIGELVSFTDQRFISGADVGGGFVWRVTPRFGVQAIVTQADELVTIDVGDGQPLQYERASLFVPSTNICDRGYWVLQRGLVIEELGVAEADATAVDAAVRLTSPVVLAPGVAIATTTGVDATPVYTLMSPAGTAEATALADDCNAALGELRLELEVAEAAGEGVDPDIFLGIVLDAEIAEATCEADDADVLLGEFVVTVDEVAVASCAAVDALLVMGLLTIQVPIAEAHAMAEDPVVVNGVRWLVGVGEASAVALDPTVRRRRRIGDTTLGGGDQPQAPSSVSRSGPRRTSWRKM